jgi:hypothetical protein
MSKYSKSIRANLHQKELESHLYRLTQINHLNLNKEEKQALQLILMLEAHKRNLQFLAHIGITQLLIHVQV